MSLSAEDHRAVRALLASMFPFFPSLISLPLLLILYNNIYHGHLILLILILLNASVIIIRPLSSTYPRAVSVAKFASLYMVSILSAVLILETLFPLVWPREYAGVLDLSKSFVNPPIKTSSNDVVLFRNADQKLMSIAADGSRVNEPFKVWHAPGKQFEYHGRDPNSQLRYINLFHWNTRGYFDHDYDLRKPAATHRIVIIGDSYVEAVQVPLMGSFHKRLETYFNAATGPGMSVKFEVIALGNSGTGQVAHHQALRKTIDTYDADTVLITLCSNDFCDDDPELHTEFLLSSRSFVSPRFRRLASHGYFALAFAFKRLEEIRANRISISPELLQWAREDIPKIEAAWARTLQKIRESRDLCRDRGVTFLLVYLGSEMEVKHAIDPEHTIARLKAMGGPHEYISWDMGKSLRRVDSFCKENDILMISLLEPLIRAQQETGHFVFGDHYTMFGHQVAARVLSSALEARLQPNFAQNPKLKYSTSPAWWNPVATPATFDASRNASFQKQTAR